MATASPARGVRGNRESCSICLEPFRGRDPKILPCFHTFCRACLAQMAEKARTEMVERQKVLVSTSDPDTEEIFINCPSCRKDVQVPAGGVQKFQTNFYLDQGEDEGHVQPMLCDLCDQGQMASHFCTKCQTKLCFHCHRAHDPCPQPASPAAAPAVSPSVSGGEVTSLLTTGRGQMEVLSKVLSRTAEEEKDLHKQRKAMEVNLQDLYSIGLARLVGAHDDILRKIRSHTETSEKKLKSEQADLQGKYDALSSFTSQSHTGAGTVADLRAALMSEPELSKLQTRAEQKPVEFFRLDAGDRSAVFQVNSLRELVFGALQLSPASREEIMLPADSGDFDSDLLFGAGTIPSSPHTQRPHIQRGYNADNAALLSRVDDLARKLEITVKKVTESESKEKRLQVEMRSVMDELRGVRDKNSFLIQDLATVQGENAKLREDVALLQRHQQSCPQDSIDRQQTGASNTDACPQKARGGASSEAKTEAVAQGMSSVVSLQIEHLQDSQKKMDGKIDLMQQSVRFLQKSTWEKADRTTMEDLRDRVESLQNSLSDFKPIYFKAELDRKVTTRSERPLICKDVNENEGGGYNSLEGAFFAPVSGTYLILVTVAPFLDDKMARLKIFHDSQWIGEVYCDTVDSSSSAHCIVEMQEGDKLWLTTFSDPSSFDKDGMTSFSGVLLMPKL